jgi:serine/threonine protein kinase
MLSYAKLCYAMLCYAMLCYATLSYATRCYAMPCDCDRHKRGISHRDVKPDNVRPYEEGGRILVRW